jgi:hypothetical protein
MTPEINQRVALLRAKAASNTMTEADMVEAIKLLRAGRVGAAAASDGARRKTAKAAIPDADSLLDELGGL